MRSQWDCLLENLGCWEGSFARLDAEGQLLGEVPTTVHLRHPDSDPRAVRITVTYRDGSREPFDRQFSSLGRDMLLFDDGAFSFGATQFGPFGEFGGEMGLRRGDRRLRLVHSYRDGHLQGLTLIREGLAGSLPANPALRLDDLLGVWEGEAETRWPDLRPPEVSPHRLTVRREGDRLLQTLETGGRTLQFEAEIAGDRLRYLDSPQNAQLLLLGDGSSCLCPRTIVPRQPFRLELGWRVGPDQRLRLSRNFDATGAWVSCTRVSETRVCSAPSDGLPESLP